MSKPSVLLFADFRLGQLGASHERAFTELGHRVHRFDVPEAMHKLAWPARNRIVHRLSVGQFGLRRAWSRGFNQQLLQAATRSGAPWVLLHNATWVMPETVRALREQGHKVVIFHADNPFPPHYNNRPETLPTAREADLYLIWSERLVARLRAENVNARFLAFGWDRQALPYQADSPQGRWPGVVFIGGWDREREAFLERVATTLPLRIYGPGYWGSRTRRGSRVRACWQGRALSLAESASVIREAGICLNILRTQHAIDGVPDGVIMRHFEVPGAGGFLLSTRSGVATRLFPEGVSGAYFADVDECIAQCRRYLEDSSGRAVLAGNAHAEVSARHTYTHRAAEIAHMLQTLADESAGQSARSIPAAGGTP